MLSYANGGPRSNAHCVQRGAETREPSPFGNVLAFCDSADDCGAGAACVYLRGENDRVECVEERADACLFHVAHVCSSAASCHGCTTGGAVTCRAALEAAAPQLRFCGAP